MELPAVFCTELLIPTTVNFKRGPKRSLYTCAAIRKPLSRRSRKPQGWDQEIAFQSGVVEVEEEGVFCRGRTKELVKTESTTITRDPFSVSASVLDLTKQSQSSRKGTCERRGKVISTSQTDDQACAARRGEGARKRLGSRSNGI